MNATRLGTVLFTLVLAACGGGKATPAPSNAGGTGGGGGDRLPWEAALTTGARFELASEMEGEESETLVITVTGVETEGAARIYKLSWGDGDGGGGPNVVRVEAGKVLIGAATAADMQEPWEQPGGLMCYGEDFSNPDGCEDVCDASLCFDASGIVSVMGLYAPNYSMFSRK